MSIRLTLPSPKPGWPAKNWRISWITYADRLMEFPSALLGVAVGTVLLPSLAKSHADADASSYDALLDWGLRLACLLALPAAVALWVLAIPLISTLYQYGRFTVDDVFQTRSALLGYSIGLLGFILVKILAPGFYARQIMKRSSEHGMMTFDQGLFELYRKGAISYEDALMHADSANEVRLMVKLGTGEHLDRLGGADYEEATQDLYAGANVGMPYYPLDEARLRPPPRRPEPPAARRRTLRASTRPLSRRARRIAEEIPRGERDGLPSTPARSRRPPSPGDTTTEPARCASWATASRCGSRTGSPAPTSTPTWR